MTIAQQTIEARGADVEEAIQEGLAELNLERDAVEVQVLDEGSSGFLGIGGRDAVVRLTVKPAHRGQTEKASPEASASAAARQSLMAALTEAEVSPETSDTSAQDVPEEDDEPAEREIAKEIVETLLARMQVEADVSLSQTEPDDLTGERRWIVNVHGEDMGALIGPRGETLNALQYIARLM
ncbi:MAG: Jag N-terminal domain-containing protein, partial [Candidatus Promineifilaceae bacterium]|nr:Jag N-terminal domain-containing protein [Candidatus Promineifilaceae bacterium]